MNGETVLVVEDDFIIRLDIVDALMDAGFNVIEAGDVLEAVRILGVTPGISAVFTDVDMPGSEDGLDLARHVRAGWPPVAILVTSGDRRVSQSDLPTDGRFLTKPYRSAEVLANLTEMIAA